MADRTAGLRAKLALSGRRALFNLAIAFTALRTNLMRSILTTLGVMIGVMAVVLAVAMGVGAKQSALESINALGSNMALIFPVPDRRDNRASGDRGRLTGADAQAIARGVDGVAAISPQIRSALTLSVAGRRADTTVIGATEGYGPVTGTRVEFGQGLDAADTRTAARVIVLGPTVAAKLFGEADPVGRKVRVDKSQFTVIGVLESKGSSFGSDNDDMALVPITVARQRFPRGARSGPDDLDALFVGFADGVDLERAKAQIVKLLRARNQVRAREVSPFTVRTTEEFIKQTGKVTAILQAVLVAIASISLLVGGIGIMNIMLVSVTERTREIGLRMALGARRSDIRNQFLVESALLCAIGGTIGLGIAFVIARIFEAQADFPAPIDGWTATGAILFSALIGIVFGSWPAIRAARLSPIEALRTE